MITDVLITVAAGPPSSPQTLPPEVTNWLSMIMSWVLYVVIAAAIIATIILGASLALDKNRGESGIPSADHTKFFRIALGVMIASSATQIALWFL
ncbi:TrbC/VirB2 family protein [Ancrocorticia populi]|uniref:TrbC/VirB2 family protein n=1 Tax=Ancrocorticia populi TaxID=2175228 RepID=UPI003F9EA292